MLGGEPSRDSNVGQRCVDALDIDLGAGVVDGFFEFGIVGVGLVSEMLYGLPVPRKRYWSSGPPPCLRLNADPAQSSIRDMQWGGPPSRSANEHKV